MSLSVAAVFMADVYPQMVLELVHQLDAPHLRFPHSRLCPGHGRKGIVPDRPG